MRFHPRTLIPVLPALTAMLVPAQAEADRRVVFVNTEQQELNSDNGQDPSQNSYSTTGFVPGTISGWVGATDAHKQELLHRMKEATVPFDIEFVLDRPASGNYDMLVFGTADDVATLFPDASCSASFGLSDCIDASMENIAFLNYGCLPEDQQSDLGRLAFFGLTAQGFGWGLDNLTGTGQIMSSYSQSGVVFGDTCTAFSGTGLCSHEGCADGEQNSTADLLARFGARVDDGPPTVTISAPSDGEIVASDVEVVAVVHDAFGGMEVQLEIVEAGQSLDDTVPPHSWSLAGVPDGAWTIRVTATDADGGTTSDEIRICVNQTECEPLGSGGTGSGDGGTGSGDGGTGSGDGGGTGDDGGTGTGSDGGDGNTGGSGQPGSSDPEQDSCACRTSGPGTLPFGLAVTILLGLTRRRR